MTVSNQMHEVLLRRKSIHPEWTDGMVACWNDEVRILSESIPNTIEYVKNCSDEELCWIGEIFDDLIQVTQSSELLELFKERVNSMSNTELQQSLQCDIKSAEEALAQ